MNINEINLYGFWESDRYLFNFREKEGKFHLYFVEKGCGESGITRKNGFIAIKDAIITFTSEAGESERLEILQLFDEKKRIFVKLNGEEFFLNKTQ